MTHQIASEYYDDVDEVATLRLEINKMTYDLKECFRRIHELELASPPKLVHGILRPMSEMSSVGCQLFYTPSVVDQPKSNKTPYSLKLQVHVNGVRAKPDIDVALYMAERFLESVDKLPCVAAESGFVRHVATQLLSQNNDNMLMGMLRKKTGGSGTPYAPNQFCMINHHGDISVQPELVFYVNEQPFIVEGWKPGAGKKANASKWFGSWKAAR